MLAFLLQLPVSGVVPAGQLPVLLQRYPAPDVVSAVPAVHPPDAAAPVLLPLPDAVLQMQVLPVLLLRQSGSDAVSAATAVLTVWQFLPVFAAPVFGRSYFVPGVWFPVQIVPDAVPRFPAFSAYAGVLTKPAFFPSAFSPQRNP